MAVCSPTKFRSLCLPNGSSWLKLTFDASAETSVELFCAAKSASIAIPSALTIRAPCSGGRRPFRTRQPSASKNQLRCRPSCWALAVRGGRATGCTGGRLAWLSPACIDPFNGYNPLITHCISRRNSLISAICRIMVSPAADRSHRLQPSRDCGSLPCGHRGIPALYTARSCHLRLDFRHFVVGQLNDLYLRNIFAGSPLPITSLSQRRQALFDCPRTYTGNEQISHGTQYSESGTSSRQYTVSRLSRRAALRLNLPCFQSCLSVLVQDARRLLDGGMPNS